MTTAEAQQELAKYIGLPKCQDCGWKLGTDITDNCHCHLELTQQQKTRHLIAYARARELQAMMNERIHFN